VRGRAMQVAGVADGNVNHVAVCDAT
jgi:hypothetical protein